MVDMKTCPVCKKLVSEDASWCPSCGTNLTATGQYQPPREQMAREPEQSWQTPTGFPASTPESPPETRLKEAIQWRYQTDKFINVIWAFLPLIGFIIGVAVTAVTALVVTDVLTLTLVSMGTGIISMVFIIILLYMLFSRNNRHTRREAMLRRSIIDFLRSRAVENGVINDISAEIQTMESIDYESRMREPERNAALWSLLPLIPVVGWIFFLVALYYLTSYPVPHDRRWHAFTQQVQSAGSKLGMSMMLPSWKTIPERSFIIYLILTILTLGLFIFYWYYVLIKDINEHYTIQWQFEDQLMREVQ